MPSATRPWPPRGPLGDAGDGRGAAWADYDGDGDLDLYVLNWDKANLLLRNPTDADNHWLHVKLVGTVSNASGIGARVRVVAGTIDQLTTPCTSWALILVTTLVRSVAVLS